MQTRASCASKSSRANEAHVVRRDDRHAAFDGEIERAAADNALRLRARALQLEVVAIAEQREPALERAARIGLAAVEDRAADVAFARAGQRDQDRPAMSAREPAAIDRRDALAAGLPDTSG